MNFKRKFVNYLKKLNSSMKESKIIKTSVNRIYFKTKIKSFSLKYACLRFEYSDHIISILSAQNILN